MNGLNIGSAVVIAKVKFENHKSQVGKKGVISKFVKSRNIFQIKLEDGSTWESFPENIKAV